MIRTLILEDSTPKLRRILNALGGVESFDLADVEHVTDIVNAKRCLMSTRYDLFILDISVPIRADQEATPDAGMKLLKEVLERDTYKVPMHIIGITGYPDVFDVVSQAFSQRLLTIITYDQTSDEWVEPVQARVRQIIAAKAAEQSERPDYRSHLAVVCALRESELPYVRHLEWNWEQFPVPDDSTIYYKGERVGHDEQHQIIYAASCPRMGLPAAAILAMKMVHLFRPRYLAMTGITAAVRQRARFGDVIVADPVWDWGSGKWTMDKDSGNPVFHPAPHQISLPPLIRKQFELLSEDKESLRRIKDDWPADKPEHELQLHIGPIASGSAVLADGITVDRIVQQHRSLLGIEMESYSLYSAAEEVSEPRPTAFAVKSVVDFGDPLKDDRFQKYAAYTSAEILRCFVENYL